MQLSINSFQFDPDQIIQQLKKDQAEQMKLAQEDPQNNKKLQNVKKLAEIVQINSMDPQVMMKGGGSPQLKALRKYFSKNLSKSPEATPQPSLEQSD